MIFLFFIVVNVTVLKKKYWRGITTCIYLLIITFALKLTGKLLKQKASILTQDKLLFALSILPSRTFYSGVVDWPVILDVCSLVNITHSPEMNSLTFLSASAYKLHHIKCFNVSQLRTTLQLVDRPKRIPDTMQSCTYRYIWSLFSLVFI